MAVDRTASAAWEGDLSSGSGSLETQSGNVSGAYSFASRFEDGSGTNPEELIAAAHAACYAMALSNILDEAGHTPNKVDASATVSLDAGAQEITQSALTVTADVPGLDADSFAEHAEAAKAGCPVSKLYAGAQITLDASLA